VSQGIFKRDARRTTMKGSVYVLDVCWKILAEGIRIDDAPSLLSDVNLSLANLEKDMPMTIQVCYINKHDWICKKITF